MPCSGDFASYARGWNDGYDGGWEDAVYEMGPGERAAVELPAVVTGECVYCENAESVFVVIPREGKALRVRCEGCGSVTEVDRAGRE